MNAEFKMNLLYVDDDPISLRLVAHMLGPCDIAVTCARSGAQALELIATQTFDAILMDYHMPDMNGVQTLEAIRALAGPNQAAPVVVVTADPAVEQAYVSLGFAGFLSKPVSLRPLLTAAMLWSVKRSAPPAQGPRRTAA